VDPCLKGLRPLDFLFLLRKEVGLPPADVCNLFTENLYTAVLHAQCTSTVPEL
jgi:hypothetical protein